MKHSYTIFFCVCFCSRIIAQTADTTIVQTFTHAAQNNAQTAYDSPGRRWFDFPTADNGLTYQKILMYYNLKCFEEGTAGNLGFPCGEWDYLTYTYLYHHTGVMDSVAATHPAYLLDAQNFDSFQYSPQAQYNIQQSIDQSSTLIVESPSYITIGESSEWLSAPFEAAPVARHQFLYKAEELTAAGLTSGDLYQLALSAQTEGAVYYSQVKVKAKWVELDSINAWSNEEFTSLFVNQINLNANGWLEFNFQNPLYWNGTSDLLLEFTYENLEEGASPLFASETTNYPCHVSAAGDERYLVFDGNDRVEIPAAAFENVSDQITIAFWINGDPDIQPADGTVFEGIGSQNQRVLNVHLPWSNGRVYWDAGNDGGYDRIDKAANSTTYEGNWNHWAFTKDTNTGAMKIYLNGVLWHSGVNLDNTMAGITAFALGAAKSWSNFYTGSVDEFAVWNVALDAATISDWMNTDLQPSHPAWQQLQCFYSFDGAPSAWIHDDSGNGHHGTILGNPSRLRYSPSDWTRNALVNAQRPTLRLFNGQAIIENNAVVNEWLTEVSPSFLTQFQIENYAPVVTNNQLVWTNAFTYTFDVQGQKIDSIAMVATELQNNYLLDYFQQPFEIIDRFELNRFITMYGIGLNLGDNGWTWVTDVTDFAPLLRDSVELEAGNWQELLDLKFVFIEGTPAREVQRVERVWDGNYALSTFDEQVTTKVIAKQPGEEAWKLLTTNTGHGFGFDANNCGEFCNNIQSVQVNGNQIANWDILQECADNPLYPQGGTWIYDRAGWCPGMNSTTKEFELTPHVGANDTFEVDYDISQDPYGNYVFFGTLIGYGPMNHAHDPEIDIILAPSAQMLHSRWNPICNQPKFVLRNLGSQPLTDLNIIFGVVGGTPQSFHWTGNLGFMQRQEVELTSLDNSMWWGDDESLSTFFIQLGFSTDGADDNPSNNYAESTFYRPATYQYTNLDDNRLIIQLKTNASNQQSSYVLYDVNGNVVFERNNFAAPNTTYRDTLELNSGCYLFHLKDSGEDGLSFFANDDGNGNCKLDRVSGLDFINFENDFGKEIKHYFNWNTDLVSVEEAQTKIVALTAYPNPSNDWVKVRASGMDRSILIRVFDATGKVVYDTNVQRRYEGEEVTLHTADWAPGVYRIVAKDSKTLAQLSLLHVD